MANTYKTSVTAIFAAWAALAALFLVQPPTYFGALALEMTAAISTVLFLIGIVACFRSSAFRSDIRSRCTVAFAVIPILFTLAASARFYLTQ